MKHQQNPLSQASAPRSTAYGKGKYGRLFPWLLPQGTDDESTRAKMKMLADLIISQERGTNSRKPAGYTYLGQFIAHDLTFDPTSIKERQIDPEQLNNFRTPALDLDSVYGAGPQVNPFLFESNKDGVPTKFQLNKIPTAGQNTSFYDLPRMPSGVAIIPDPRNDENIFVSQFHVAFMLLHNHFVDALSKKYKGEALFLEAQRMLRWHYQYVILNDYLNMVLEPETVRNALPNETANHGYPNLKFFDWRNEPFIPLEFSGAVFRFGHSQIRESYRMQNDRQINLFEKRAGVTPKEYVDWSVFFDTNPPTNPFLLVDQKLSKSLATIPGLSGMPEINLAYHNLIRGLKLELPSGQAIARAMGQGVSVLDRKSFQKANIAQQFPEFETIQNNSEITDFLDNTPLWYYILLEAKIAGGQNLGPVGSRIVAEVIIGMIQGDKTSYLNHDPSWTPKKFDKNAKEPFTMKSLLEMGGIYEGALVK